MKRGRPPRPAGPLVRDYLAGNSIRKVARMHSVSPALVRRALMREGVQLRPDPQPDRERDLAIIRLRDELGLTWTEIATATGIPTSTLQRHYARATQRPARPHTESEPWESLAAMYKSGRTVTEIATVTGADPKTIQRRLQQHGAHATDVRYVSRQALRLSDDQLRERHETGETYAELAAICGASPTLIWRRVNFRYPQITDADAD